MKQRRITVLIGEDGKITADAEGFTGDACLHDLEQLLSGLDSHMEITRKPDSGSGPTVRTSNTISTANTNRRRLGGLQ